jgi:hypothetical protein
MQSARRLTIAIIAMLSLALFSPAMANAQSKVSFKLSPTTIEDKVDPGAERDFVLTVQNQGDGPATLYPSAQNITGIGPDFHSIYSTVKDAEGYALASWITYKESSITIAPGQEGKLHFTVKFPTDAHPGSHMAGIFLSDKPTDSVQNGTSIGFEIGSILNFQVAGDIVENTQVREFYTTKTVYGEPKVGFTTKVENLGNILSRPHGLIDITNMFGKKVASIPVNDSMAGVFPKATREFSSEWKSDDLELGRYTAVVALAVEGQSGTQTISRVIEFWVMPMNIIGPILGGLLFLIVIVYIIIRLYVRAQLAGISRPSRRSRDEGLSKSAAIVIALLVAIIIGLAVLFFYFG